MPLAKPLLLKLFLLASLSVWVLFLWQGHKGFNIADEGFLWYGAQRVMVGEIPVRDFCSYDPGRYYWSAVLMLLQGSNGIIALRVAVALFQIIGLFVGLLLIARNCKKGDWHYLLISNLILLAWMFPRHKFFDITLSILLIAALAFLIRNPVGKRYFITGICLGLVACFGRNHGIYGVVATCGVLFWLNIRELLKISFLNNALLFGAGVIFGYTPILLMIGLVPRFGIAFWKSIQFLFEIKATNIPLPIPWPWLVSFSSMPFGEALRGILIGLFFITLVAFGVLAIGWVFLQQIRKKEISPELVAATFLVLPYAHYAYSRADVGHLALGIFPFLIGSLIILGKQSNKVKWVLAFLLCAASGYVMYVYHPGWQYRKSANPIGVTISGSTLFVHQGIANDITLLQTLADKYAPRGEAILAVPGWPGAYALLERPSPITEIYPLLPVSNSFQEEEIQQIKTSKPQCVVLLDVPLDGRDDLRFKNTHPLIYQYIIENFEPISGLAKPAYFIYQAKKN